MNATTNQCDHKWIDMEDGTLDQFCLKCKVIQRQAVIVDPIIVKPCAPIRLSKGDILKELHNKVLTPFDMRGESK